MYQPGYEIRCFTLVPLPDDVKVQLVDQAVADLVLSWFVNDDGSVTASLKEGTVKFMPTEPVILE